MSFVSAANVLVNKGKNGIINFQTAAQDVSEAIIFNTAMTIRIQQDREVQAEILQTIQRVEAQEGEMLVADKEDLEVGVLEEAKKISHLIVVTLIPVATSASAPKLQV